MNKNDVKIELGNNKTSISDSFKIKNPVNKSIYRINKYSVSIISCTNKINNMKNIFNNYNRQNYKNKELIIILNNNKLNINMWQREALKHNRVKVFQLDEKFTFGQCKNFAVNKCISQFITHFDDDDYYAPEFISSSIIALKFTNADIVGKKCAYVYFEDKNLLGLRFPTYDYRYVDFVLDSSMVINRRVFKKVTFPKLKAGTDFQFQIDCKAKGFKIFSSDRHNYMFIRHKSKSKHTWKMSDSELLKECIVIKNTPDYKRYVNQSRNWYKLYQGKSNLKNYKAGSMKSALIKKYNNNTINNHGISVITCTNRPHYIDNLINNYLRQSYEKKELIIVVNRNNIDINTVKQKVAKYKDINVYQLNEDNSLGKCLNYAIKKSSLNNITKFDDDDYYGPHYLIDSLYTLLDSGASIIGKGAYHVYFKDKKILAIRVPSEENRWSNFVSGATIFFKRDVFRKVQFQDITVGEDVAFYKDCINKGFKIYSGNRFHHVYIRHTKEDKHTYNLSDEEFLKCCAIIAPNIKNYKSYVNF